MDYEIPENIQQKIDAWLQKFPKGQRQAALIPALTLVQNNHNGWLSKKAIQAVANYLKIPHISAFEVASFYSMYDLKPTGKYKICVCTNVSCMLNGSKYIGKHLKQRLGINYGQTTEDGLFSLKSVECLAACGGAPVVHINGQYYESLTTEKLDHLLDKLD